MNITVLLIYYNFSLQVYLYEYGDLGPEERPRQICPYAYVSFVYIGKGKAGGSGSARQIRTEQTR